ncbi:hypothetical protein B0H16DRAFT_1533771 [Mycena metata]|uniref:Uncharacterized protein n=1 Tax=Mycena metata TaxID=1033252 RepID=A0AAD7J904_9AGAR|nr:hypothetical protein B0H16DRAFT_1533771 [Mycena metata]
MTKKSSSVSAQAASNQVDLNQAASTQPAAPSMTIDYVVYTFVPDSGSAFSSQSASAHAASNQPMTPCTTKKNKVFIGAMAGGIIGGTIGGISSLVLLLVLFFLRRRAMGKSRRRAISRRNLPFIDEHDDKRKSVWKDSDIHDSPAVGDEDLLVAAEVRRLIAALQRLETGMTEAHDGGPVIFQRPPAYGGRVGAVN